MMISFHLPYPPSVNRYWRHPTRGKLAGRHLISRDGRAYRSAVIAACMEQRLFKCGVAGRLEIHLLVTPPDKRRRDLDNIAKACLDGIVHAGVIQDDEQFDRITIERERGQILGVHVHIRQISLP